MKSMLWNILWNNVPRVEQMRSCMESRPSTHAHSPSVLKRLFNNTIQRQSCGIGRILHKDGGRGSKPGRPQQQERVPPSGNFPANRAAAALRSLPL